jgi:CheY-like chemotaxis protein
MVSNLLAEDEAFGNFMNAMKDGPAVEEGPAEVAPEVPGAKKSGLLEQFFEDAPKRIAMARKIFSAIGRAGDASARQKIVDQVAREVGWLKNISGMPELLPAWQMAAALEGLFGQLTRNASNATPSALRTAAAALDLLQDLCVPGVTPNLTKKPPVRLLVVDDDAISRSAVSLALRKIFPEPQLAEGGEAALELAAKQAYDAIFLDVEMPGMDGFELCTRIHDTVSNCGTPIVFVTRHCDFAARASSTLSGAEELIGKPFLAFEITVKALTLVLRGRLQNEGTARPSAMKAASIRAVVTERIITKDVPAASLPDGPLHPGEKAEEDKIFASQNAPNAPHAPNAPDASHAPFEPSAADFARAFFTHAPAHLEELRNQLEKIRYASKPADIQECLGELYVGIHSLRAETERAELRAVARLAFSLESMLKKLLDQPRLCTPCALDTAVAALEVIEKLSRAGYSPDLANEKIRILVVDDDPVILRVISGSVQLAFGRPESAESGEAALALAAEKAFDLIFLDVRMPGIDGFATCAKIHETALNPFTPVVFVTALNDLQSRSQAATAGGLAFIPKPVLSSQITLTALTFVLGSRFEKTKPERVAEPLEAAFH